ncbi:MAG: hypothetical protein GC200_00380 [Tepidisphaera sp.]|nr:hypothetical protein [Tepidisphaera sp.]
MRRKDKLRRGSTLAYLIALIAVSLFPRADAQPNPPITIAPPPTTQNNIPKTARASAYSEGESLWLRVHSGQLSPAELDAAATKCVSDLKSDSIDWNAVDAMAVLRLLGPRAIPQLEAALNSTDHQQRQLAAHALRSLDNDHFDRQEQTPSPITITPALIRVTIEGLQNDDFPRDRKTGKCTEVANAHSGFIFLFHHYALAKDSLQAAASSPDPQQRFYAAAIIGLSHDTALATLVAPTLAEHLGNNNIEGDSRLSMAALSALGPQVVPILSGYLSDADPQRRSSARIICKDLLHKPWTDQDRADLKQISTLVHRPSELQDGTLSSLLDGLRFP